MADDDCTVTTTVVPLPTTESGVIVPLVNGPLDAVNVVVVPLVTAPLVDV
jgi:hypothetical protein